MVKHVLELEQRMDASLLARRSWHLHLLMRPVSTRSRRHASTWASPTQVLVQTSIRYCSRPGKMSRYIMPATEITWPHSCCASRWPTYSRSILRAVACVHSVSASSWRATTMKMVHRSSSSRHRERTTAGRPPRSARIQARPRVSWRSVTPTTSTSKTQFTRPSWPWKTRSRASWPRKISRSAWSERQTPRKNSRCWPKMKLRITSARSSELPLLVARSRPLLPCFATSVSENQTVFCSRAIESNTSLNVQFPLSISFKFWKNSSAMPRKCSSKLL